MREDDMMQRSGAAAQALRKHLDSGALAYGMQCFTASPIMIEAMGTAGMHFTTIDMEHCPAGLQEVAHGIRAAENVRLTPFVRVPHLEPSTITRVLDLGAAGVVVPHASLEVCRQAVRAAKYAPLGARGACPVVRAAGYAPQDWHEFAASANSGTMVIPLLEDVESIEQMDDMMALPGIDIMFVGPWDLSLSLGVPAANFDHPRMAEVLDGAVAAARRNGKHVMTTVGATIDLEYASRLVSRGVSLLSFSADVMVFLEAARKITTVQPAKGTQVRAA
jgi:4-hydroxy-2-oxoheptanedioate aldolase